MPCHQAWHAKCYECLGNKIFPLKVLTDDMGNPWYKPPRRQVESWCRRGTSFNTIPSYSFFLPGNCDEAFRMSICRANLDAMVGRAVGTIESHVREAKLAITNSQRIGKTPGLPEQGPRPLEDTFGMSTAVDMMQRSITSKHGQWVRN